jgi:tetratricopeptide (TPR) repeat protein
VTSYRHAAYYTNLLAEREPTLKGARQAAATAELSAEIDNIRAAWQWALARGWRDAIVRAGETLQWFCEFRSWYQEGAALFATAAAQFRTAMSASTADDRSRALGIVLSHYGYLAARLGAFEQAGEALAESLTLLDDGRDPLALARTLVHQGIVACGTGDYGAAPRAIDQSLTLATAGGCVDGRAVPELGEHRRPRARRCVRGRASISCGIGRLASARKPAPHPLVHHLV